MKSNIFKKLTVSLLLIGSSVGMGLAEIKEMILIKAPVIKVDEEPNEHRMPARPIQCTISEDGIFIQGYETIDIISYEVYDRDGKCLLMTDDPQEFIPFILNSGNGLEIRFCSSEFMLKGFI